MTAEEGGNSESRTKENARPRLRKDLIQREALQMVPEAIARQYSLVPLEVEGDTLRVAMANPNDIRALEALQTRTRMRVESTAATRDDILDAIDFSYRSTEEIEKQVSGISLPDDEVADEADALRAGADAPVAKTLMLIIDEAVKARASDIHLQPEEDGLRVRYRIDGTLHETITLPLGTAGLLISRIKVLAKMNIADRNRPQDGQMSVIPKNHQEMDIRVATIPNVHGEMAALRLLDKSKAILPLQKLGFLPQNLVAFDEMLKVPYGMILVTGPTGAGKTTTLYAALNSLDRKGRNIITIEDPVEYRFKNINQIQVNPRSGLTFASGLRSILRLDPDVLLVGEMRDAETANIAIQSALTGHLVLSTIHANDAVGVVSRLLDLGIEPFLIASALIGVVAQRMGRRTCPDCVETTEVSVAERMAYAKETGDERSEFPCGAGCKSCAQTGYQGRIGLFEILRISEGIRTMLLSGGSAAELRALALEEGMVPLIQDGMLKVKAGITTPAEVLSNAYTVL